MTVKIIKSEKEYEAAMARLSALMDVDVVPGSEEEAELELLALVIEDYERGIVRIAAPSPLGKKKYVSPGFDQETQGRRS